ncbi:hypothetical protein HCN44_003393 [Aphidius gifuensis]|uniref:proline--tRNA ligase n=1 Tax=Aphidius gifuensis TaxID=684658 RepID=A0A834XVP2_APHGI|nr:hypothetical protein HCN44_003393 [Aphidius gifuensis]
MTKILHRVTKLFQPVVHHPEGATPKCDTRSKSYQLMIDLGIISSTSPGMYSLLPLGLRSLEKLIKIVDYEMESIDGQKLLLPSLTNTKLWEKSGRLNDNIDSSELFQLKDRHGHSYLLSPTYEEAITSFLSSRGKIERKSLPLLLYQISTKWRDEMKPRLGLFRGREFIMKDLYSFDIDIENAQKTYELVGQSYENILLKIGLPYIIAESDTGSIGGIISHEYLYPANIGEDTIMINKKSNLAINSSLFDEKNKYQADFEKVSAIEIGHTFLLGSKYSKPLGATCRINGSNVPLTMGCFGLGLTRLMAASLEISSTDKCLRWPKLIAPFTVYLIPPKELSHESIANHFVDKILDILNNKNIDVIVDDRTKLTIGNRMVNAKRTGYPYIIVVGKSAILENPLFEILDVNNEKQYNFSVEQLNDFFSVSNNYNN